MSAPASQPQRPITDDRDAWRTYWQAQGISWRTEPEIDEERQRFLAERRATAPDLVRGIYPFSGIRLSRADVEWLLATHESLGACGPVVWDEGKDKPVQERRVELDLRGAHLEGLFLSLMPLTRLRGGLSLDELNQIPTRELADKAVAFDRAAVHFEKADFSWAELTNAELPGAHLEGAYLVETRLEKASLSWAHLEYAHLMGTHLEGANLTRSFSSKSVRSSIPQIP
jgi:hypothetical protein